MTFPIKKLLNQIKKKQNKKKDEKSAEEGKFDLYYKKKLKEKCFANQFI